MPLKKETPHQKIDMYTKKLIESEHWDQKTGQIDKHPKLAYLKSGRQKECIGYTKKRPPHRRRQQKSI
jgi:hypothetical protein